MGVLERLERRERREGRGRFDQEEILVPEGRLHGLPDEFDDAPIEADADEVEAKGKVLRIVDGVRP